MAKTRTVKPVEQGAFKATFPDARITEFVRMDPASCALLESFLAATRRQRPRDIVTKALQDYFRKEGYQRPDGKNKNRKTS